MELDSAGGAPAFQLKQERRESPSRVGGRLVLVLSGSVRHGDWAVARERFSGGAGVCEAARPRRRTFQFLEVAQCWARGVTGVGISCNV